MAWCRPFLTLFGSFVREEHDGSSARQSLRNWCVSLPFFVPFFWGGGLFQATGLLNGLEVYCRSTPSGKPRSANPPLDATMAREPAHARQNSRQSIAFVICLLARQARAKTHASLALQDLHKVLSPDEMVFGRWLGR